MPRVKIEYVVSFSSEDPKHPANNLLEREVSKKNKWLCTAGQSSCSVVLQLAKAVKISAVHIGVYHAALVEVLVGRSEKPHEQFEVLVPRCVFLSPAESRGAGVSRVRSFCAGAGHLAAAAAQRWDRLRLVCSQPYNKHAQYGILFIHVDSSEDGVSTPGGPSSVPSRLFNVEAALSSDEEEFHPGELFAKHVHNNKDKQTSTESQIRQASSDAMKNIPESSSLTVVRCRSRTRCRAVSRSPPPAISDGSTSGNTTNKRDSVDKNRDEVDNSRDKVDHKIDKRDDSKPRDKASNLRDKVDNKGDERDHVSNPRDKASNSRGKVGNKGEERDHVSNPRDKASNLNDNSHGNGSASRDKDKTQRNKNNNKCDNDINLRDNINQLRTGVSEDARGDRTGPTPRNRAETTPRDRAGTTPRDHADQQTDNDDAVGPRCSSPLRGVVFALSGYENPERGQLRDAALRLGAVYRRQWTDDCTHLVCAFPNTPKLKELRARGSPAPAVLGAWLHACAHRRRRLPWRWHATEPRERRDPPPPPPHDHSSHSSEHDTDDEIQEAMRQQKKRRHHSPEARGQRDAKRPNTADRDDEHAAPPADVDAGAAHDDSDDVMFVVDERMRGNVTVHDSDSDRSDTVTVTDADTDTDTDTPLHQIDEDKCLPHMFDGYTFAIDESVTRAHHDAELIARYVRAYGGLVVNDCAAVTADYTVCAGSGERAGGGPCRVSPRWLWACHRSQDLVPPD